MKRQERALRQQANLENVVGKRLSRLQALRDGHKAKDRAVQMKEKQTAVKCAEKSREIDADVVKHVQEAQKVRNEKIDKMYMKIYDRWNSRVDTALTQATTTTNQYLSSTTAKPSQSARVSQLHAQAPDDATAKGTNLIKSFLSSPPSVIQASPRGE